MAFLPQNLSRTGSCLGGAEHTRSIKSNWLFLVQLVQAQKLVVQRTLRQPHPRPTFLARNIFMISMRANGLASCLAASFLNRNSNGDTWGVHARPTVQRCPLTVKVPCGEKATAAVPCLAKQVDAPLFDPPLRHRHSLLLLRRLLPLTCGGPSFIACLAADSSRDCLRLASAKTSQCAIRVTHSNHVSHSVHID